MASKKFDINELKIIRESWDDIPVEVIPVKYRDTYRNRKEAVDMYIDGYSSITILKHTGILHNHIPDFIQKMYCS